VPGTFPLEQVGSRTFSDSNVKVNIVLVRQPTAQLVPSSSSNRRYIQTNPSPREDFNQLEAQYRRGVEEFVRLSELQKT
jgi:hypothetical protein